VQAIFSVGAGGGGRSHPAENAETAVRAEPSCQAKSFPRVMLRENSLPSPGGSAFSTPGRALERIPIRRNRDALCILALAHIRDMR